MGQQQNNQVHPILDHNWVTLTSDSHTMFSNVNPYAKRTLRNTNNHQQVEEYHLQFSSQYDYQHYVDQLRIRMQPNHLQACREDHADGYYHLSPFIYTVKYFIDNTVKDMCSTVHKGLLYAQKVDLRLKQINDIPLSDQLYLIKATLQGFKLLYQQVGYFDITEEMVFIDKEGRVKVWINSNLSKNEALFIPHVASRDAHGSQSDMIVQLLDLIEQNSDLHQEEGIRFKQYLINKGIYSRLSFYRALQQFEAYCLEWHHLVENSMKSIYELYHQDQAQHSDIIQPSRKINNNQPTKLGHMQMASQIDNKKLIASKVSRCSDGRSIVIHRQNKVQQIHRPKSINKNNINQLSYHQSRLPTTFSYQNEKSRHMPAYHNHFLTAINIPQPVRQTSPVVRVRAPSHSVSRRSQHNSTVQNMKQTVIKFNYLPTQPTNVGFNLMTQSIKPSSQYIPHNLVTIKTIRTDSMTSTKQMNPLPKQTIKQNSHSQWINYYTSDQTYTLDREIAEDLEKYLGYHINK